MPAKTKPETEGVKHARAIEAAIAFYVAAYPDDYAAERNVPFAGHIDTVTARLRNK